MRKKVVPGDSMIIEGFLKSFRRGVAQGHVEAKVNGEFALSADLKIALPDIMREFIPEGK
jgi:3-hydroxyacyl-[acyl-carrier-protein] dehydratase